MVAKFTTRKSIFYAVKFIRYIWKILKGTFSATYHKIAFALRKIFVRNKVSNDDFIKTQYK